MVSAKANGTTSAAGEPKFQKFGASGSGTQLRFLSTAACLAVGYYPLLYIDRAMEQAGVRSVSNIQSKAGIFVAKVASRARLPRNLHRSAAGPVFVSLMGLSEDRILPFSCWSEIVPYCFDCWPSFYERWTSFFKRNRVRVAFFSARQSAEYFSEMLPKMRSVWLPEATDPNEYRPSRSLQERDIDVLELGRKNHSFHARIKDALAAARKTHLFERVPGQIVFPDKAGFIDGLSRSKISICFPSSQTHPERSGSVETVTHRYFESMASKCLILGHGPQELTDLFGYNPVLEAEPGHEFEQIESVLTNLDSFQDLVEKNYRRLLEVGTWKERVVTIVESLR